MAVRKRTHTRASGRAAATPTKPTRTCACGCGESTRSYFAMGHDARFKGAMLRIERGEQKKSKLLTTAVIRAYKWTPTRSGGERTTTDYRGNKHSGYDK